MLTGTNTILVPTDFSDAAELALQAALELARIWGSALEILHVNEDAVFMDMTPGGVLPVPINRTQALAGQKELLEETASRVRESGVICRTSTSSGKAHTEIVDHAHRVGAGLIAMGTHEHRGLGGVLSKHVAEKVLHRAPCPVLVVPFLPVGEAQAQTDFESSEDPESPLGTTVVLPESA